MKIFFTASFEGKKTYQKNYDKIVAKLKAEAVDLISPELGNYQKILTPRELIHEKTKEEKHYLAIKKGILWADAVVMEISQEDFQLGHEATLTTQSGKHVLCLSVNENYSKKIKNRFFHAAKYNDFSYEELIENFIAMVNKNQLELRFNMFLSARQKTHLEKMGNDNNVNLSEYIRMLIDRDIEGTINEH